MIILFQIIRKFPDVEIENRALFKIAELVAYAMGLNLFFLGAEVFKEFYSGSIDTYSIRYLYLGLHGKTALVPWIWFATALNITAFFMFLFPRTRENFLTLNMSCIFIIVGVYIEKGLGLVVPGFVPDTLGEIYEYAPTKHEILVAVGIWATGALIYTMLLKFAIPVYTGKLRFGVSKEGVPARHIMTKKLVTVTPEVTIEEISRLFTSRHISAVPVVDKDNKVIGVVSESDIILNVMRHEPDFAEKLGGPVLPDTKDINGDKYYSAAGGTAADIMTSPAVTAPEEATLQELNRIIVQKKIRRVFIVDSSGHPIGMISRGDIMKMLGKYLER